MSLVLDTGWFLHSDVTVSGKVGNTLIWQMDPSAFESWNTEGWAPIDFSFELHLEGSSRKVSQVLWHPTVQHILKQRSCDQGRTCDMDGRLRSHRYDRLWRSTGLHVGGWLALAQEHQDDHVDQSAGVRCHNTIWSKNNILFLGKYALYFPLW